MGREGRRSGTAAPSFPTRRSSDLRIRNRAAGNAAVKKNGLIFTFIQSFGDRKSTRLNSSHSQISYAVFCLKKKKTVPFHLTFQRMLRLFRGSNGEDLAKTLAKLQE